MHLYTLILDYAGGTYVSQLEAADENNALAQWIVKLTTDQIADAVSNEIAAAFDPELDGNAVALDGLASAWFASSSAKEGLVSINIVKTAL